MKWRYKAPSIKNLMCVPTVDARAARLIRKVIHGTVAPEKVSPACAAWVARCYWEPDSIEKMLEAVNELSNGFGVESIPDARRASLRGERVRYVNQGDTYATTILYDPLTDRWWVGCWGDVAERVGKFLL